MKTKIIILALLITLTTLITGCMRPNDTICNYDGVCTEDETDDCPDCEDVMGRGVPVPPDEPPAIENLNS